MNLSDKLLAAFRELPEAQLKSEVPTRTKTLDTLLDRIVKKYNIETPRIEVVIMQNWRDIVGASNAHRCKPSKIVDEHTLLITTLNTTLRMELQFQQDKILKNLQRFCGDKAIRQVLIR